MCVASLSLSRLVPPGRSRLSRSCAQEETLGKLADTEAKVEESAIKVQQDKSERSEQVYKGEIDRLRGELCVPLSLPRELSLSERR